MAALHKHLSITAAVSLAATWIGLAGGVLDQGSAAACLVIGLVGGLLPDVDADGEKPGRPLVDFIAVALSFLIVLTHYETWSPIALMAGYLGTFMLVHYGAYPCLRSLTVQGGAIHSLPAALLFALASVLIGRYALALPDTLAWSLGSFLLLGYVTHLVVDDLAGANATGERVRRSFGAALKLFNRREPVAFSLLYASLAAAIWLAPSPDGFINQLEQGLHTLPVAAQAAPALTGIR